MKHLTTLLFLLITFSVSAQFSGFGIWSANNHWIHPSEYLRQDRLTHAGAGFVIGSVTTALAYRIYEGDKKTNAVITGVMAAFIAGLVKEGIDDQRERGTFDEVDVWATFWGGVAGSLTINYTFNYATTQDKPVYQTRKYSLLGKREFRELAMEY